MNTEQYRKDIEKRILLLLEKGLLSGKINAGRAQEIAQYIVDTLTPHMSLEEIYKKAEHFDEHFAELIPVTLPIMDEYDDKIREVVTNHVHTLLQVNSIDAALHEVQKGLRKEVAILE